MKYQAIVKKAEDIVDIDSLIDNLEDRGVIIAISDSGTNAVFASPGKELKIRANIHYTVVADDRYDKDDFYQRRYKYKYLTVFSRTKPKINGKAKNWKEIVSDRDINDNMNYVSFHERLTHDWSAISHEWSVLSTNINGYHGLEEVLDFLISVYTDEDDEVLIDIEGDEEDEK